MNPPDEDKITFTTGQKIYYYKVMPFRLKNVEATFQWMVNKVFKDLIGNTMAVYIDEMLVKSVRRTEHLQDLDKTLNLLKRYEVKLNPEECTFRVASRKFLVSYLVTQQGIEADLDISNTEHEVTHLYKGGPDAERVSCNPQSIHHSIHR